MRRNSLPRKLLASSLRIQRTLRRRPKRFATAFGVLLAGLVMMISFQNCELRTSGSSSSGASGASGTTGGGAANTTGSTNGNPIDPARLENGRPFFKDSANGSNNAAGWSNQYFNPNNITLTVKVGLGSDGGNKSVSPVPPTFNSPSTWTGLRVYAHAGMSTRGVRETDPLLDLVPMNTQAITNGPIVMGTSSIDGPAGNQSQGSGLIAFGFDPKPNVFCPAQNGSVDFKIRLVDANSTTMGLSNNLYLTGFSHHGANQSRNTEDFGNAPTITVNFQNTCPRESEVAFPWSVTDESTNANFVLDQDDKFGSSVTVNGEILVITAEADSAANNSVANSGAAYVYRRVNNAWAFQRKINGTGAQDRTNAAAIGDGGEIALGAAAKRVNNVSGRGAVTVYTQSVGADGRYAYTSVGTLAPSPANQYGGDYFGSAVGFRGPYLFVGASGDSSDATQQGAVYVYSRATRAFLQKLVPKDASGANLKDGAGAGQSISATTLGNGNILLAVGAPLVLPYADASGAVIIFECSPSGANPCTQRQYIVESSLTSGSRFGSAVAIEASPNGAVHLVVGASGGNGNAFYYMRSPTGTSFVQQRFTNNLAGEPSLKRVRNDQASFGASISLAYPYVAIGAPSVQLQVNGQNQQQTGGVVYIVKLDRQSSNNVAGDYFRLRPRTMAVNGLFGWSVALRPQSGTPELIAGARQYPGKNAAGNGSITASGAVFSIDVPAQMQGDL